MSADMTALHAVGPNDIVVQHRQHRVDVAGIEAVVKSLKEPGIACHRRRRPVAAPVARMRGYVRPARPASRCLSTAPEMG